MEHGTGEPTEGPPTEGPAVTVGQGVLLAAASGFGLVRMGDRFNVYQRVGEDPRDVHEVASYPNEASGRARFDELVAAHEAEHHGATDPPAGRVEDGIAGLGVVDGDHVIGGVGLLMENHRGWALVAIGGKYAILHKDGPDAADAHQVGPAYGDEDEARAAYDRHVADQGRPTIAGLARRLASISEAMEPVIEFSAGYRLKLIERGFAEETAGDMAASMHGSLMDLVFAESRAAQGRRHQAGVGGP